MTILQNSLSIITETSLFAKALALGASIMTFLFIKPIIGIIWGILIVLDTITGIIKARACNEPVLSKTMWKKLNMKIWSYLIPIIILALMAIMTSCMFGPTVGIIFIYIQYFILWLQASREAISIIENAQDAGLVIPYADKIVKLLTKSQHNIEHKIDEICKEETDEQSS